MTEENVNKICGLIFEERRKKVDEILYISQKKIPFTIDGRKLSLKVILKFFNAD